MSKIVVVTVATHEEGYIDSLRDGLYPTPLLVVGLGERWDNYTTKTKLLHNYLMQEGVKLPQDTIFVVCDAYDVLYNKRYQIADLQQEFLARNVDIMFSSFNFANEMGYVKYYANNILRPISFDSNFILSCNTGLYMGYRRALLPVLEKMLSVYDYDDERRLNTVLREC